MEWQQIWELISPYINTTAIVTAVGVIIKIVASIRSEAKRTAVTLKSNTDVIEVFKKSLPNELVVSVEKLSQIEFEKLKTELKKEFIDPMEKQTKTMENIARAIVCLKSIPDGLRTEILASLEPAVTPVETTKVVLKINPELESIAAKKTVEVSKSAPSMINFD